MSIGLFPMAQPPGSLKITCPQRARVAPIKKTEDLIFFIRFCGIQKLFTGEESTTISLPSHETLHPISCNMDTMVRISESCGQFLILLVRPEIMVAAKMGRTAFLAPFNRYSPSKVFPPVI
jgi:hypothetical protein